MPGKKPSLYLNFIKNRLFQKQNILRMFLIAVFCLASLWVGGGEARGALLFDGKFEPGDHWINRNFWQSTTWPSGPSNYNACIVNSNGLIVVSDPRGIMGNVGKYTVNSGDACNSSNNDERSEISTRLPQPIEGEDNYYGFSVMLDSTWQNSGSWSLFWQIHTLASVRASMELDNRNGNIVWMDNPLDNARPEYLLLSGSQFPKGIWHYFVIRIKYSTTNAGVVQIWHKPEEATNYNLIFTRNGQTWASSAVMTDLQYGYYRSKTSLITQTLYHGPMKVGTTFDDVKYGGSSSDTAPPTISITCPTGTPTYSSNTISLSGKATDIVGVNSVTVKDGNGNWQPVKIIGEGWEVSNITLSSANSGVNIITAKATDAAGNFKETSITVTYNPTATSKPAIGNYDYSYYSPVIRGQQNKSEITWDVIVKKMGLGNIRSGVTTVYYDMHEQKDFKMTNLNYVEGRFEQATIDATNHPNWEYGVFLLFEEVMTPVERARSLWMQATLNTWTIDGTKNLAGVQINALKPWYIAKYGSWNEAWWESVRNTNNFNDNIIKEWNDEYSLSLYKAWDLHMQNLGKKSAVMGLLWRTINFDNGMQNNYGTKTKAYILNNYDLLIQYTYPTLIGCNSRDCTDNSGLIAQIMQSKSTGKVGWLLTAEWSDGVGIPWLESVASDEFNKVAPYADIIFARGTYNCSNAAKGCTSPATSEYYPPYLISFWNSYAGASTPLTCAAPTDPTDPTDPITPTPLYVTPTLYCLGLSINKCLSQQILTRGPTQIQTTPNITGTTPPQTQNNNFPIIGGAFLLIPLILGATIYYLQIRRKQK